MVFLECLKEENKGNDDVLYKKLKKLQFRGKKTLLS